MEQILPTVVRPARYTGNEWNSVVKEWPGRLHVALVFPNVYEEAICDPWMQSVYALLNADDGILCERAYLPWPDMDEALLAAGIPLCALESKHPLADFDALLVILPGELCQPCLLTALQLAQLPLRSSERRGTRLHPFVIGIGPCTANPAPVAEFCDAFLIGDIDAAGLRQAVTALRSPQPPLPDGLYLPHAGGAELSAVRAHWLPAAPRLPARPIVPFVEARHERGLIDLSYAPLYPWAGLPWRERSPEEILAAVEAVLSSTGYDHIQLAGPHSRLAEIVDRLSARYGGTRLHFAIEGLAARAELIELADRLPRQTRGVLDIQLAPGSDDEAVAALRLAFRRGWHMLRLHAQVGAPAEPWEDVERLVNVARRVRDAGHDEAGGQAQVHVLLSPFIPRAHSPQERQALLMGEEWERRLELLNKGIRGPGLRLHWRGLQTRMTEAALARGDGRLAAVIEAAWRAGMRRPEDAANAGAWHAAFAAAGLDVATDAAREIAADEPLPWQRITLS